jgi:hypothetical protein
MRTSEWALGVGLFVATRNILSSLRGRDFLPIQSVTVGHTAGYVRERKHVDRDTHLLDTLEQCQRL